MLTKKSIALAGLLLAALSVWAKPFPKLSIYTEDWPPYQYEENKQLKGISVDLLALMLKHVGSTQTVSDMKIVPWARGMLLLKSEKNTVLFLTTRTAERNDQFKWVGPVFKNRSFIIALKSNHISIKNKDELRKLRSAAVRGDVSSAYLNKMGMPKQNLALANNSSSVVRMLSFNRTDIIIDNWDNFSSIVSELGLNISDFEVVGEAYADDVSYAFNIQTEDEVVERLQQALDLLTKDGSVDALFNQYKTLVVQ